MLALIKIAVLGCLIFEIPDLIWAEGNNKNILSAETQKQQNAKMNKQSPPFSKQAVAAEATEAPPVETKEDPAKAIDPMLRDTLQRKQNELDRKEQDLNALEQNINTKLAELQSLESRMQVMLKDAQAMKDEKLRHLVDVYTNMKSKQAAQVLETLDEDTAVRILAAMRGRQAGEILTNVNPEKAAKLSEKLTKMQLPFKNN